jgi:hypothetical protein
MTVTDIWDSSGFRLLRRDEDGYLTITDDYLRVYFMRPEVRPEADSCAAERSLHARLMDDPRRAVTDADVAAVADKDVADNFRVLLAFRDRLIANGSLERSYMSFFAGDTIDAPQLFLDQMTHAMLGNILRDCDDFMRLRAAELLFRTQRVSLQDDAILLADEEIVEMHAKESGQTPLDLLAMAEGGDRRSIELDVMTAENKALYAGRSDRFDMVLDLRFTGEGLDALCRVLEAWVRHLLGLEVNIQPVRSIDDDHWIWHLGLDGESSAILNDLYDGKPLDDDDKGRILALFELRIPDASVTISAVSGRPIYLGLAMTSANRLTLKPQNLLFNLPLLEN